VGCEPGISVTDDSFGESKPSIEVVEIEFGNLRSGDHSCTREEYCTSGASMVDDREDCVVSFAVR